MRTLGWIFYAQAGMPNKRLGQSKPVWRALNEGEAPGPNWTMTRELPIPCKCLKELAGTTGLEPAASAVTGQRFSAFQRLIFSTGAASRCKESQESVSCG